MTDNLIKPFCELQNALDAVRVRVSQGRVPSKEMHVLDKTLVAYLNALNNENAGLRSDVSRAEQEFEKKDAALKIAGDELRAAQEKASSGNRLVTLEDAWAHSTKIASGIFVGEALKEAQAVVAEWLAPDGIRARDAMKKLVGILDNEGLVMAQRHFPGTDDRG